MTDEPELDGAPPARNLGGRPPHVIDLEVVRNSAAIGCTADEISSILGMARSTLYEHMQRNPAVQEAMDAGRDKGRATLRRFQWNRAEAGSDTILVWLGKQMLGQKDKSEVTGADNAPIMSGLTVAFVKPEPQP